MKWEDIAATKVKKNLHNELLFKLAMKLCLYFIRIYKH